MAAISKEGRAWRSPTESSTRHSWIALVVILAVMLAGTTLVTANARAAGTSDHAPPKTVLIKGETVLQKGHLRSYSWNYHVPGEGWQRAQRRVDEYAFPRRPPLLQAGKKKLRVRIHKPQRPEHFSVIAYRGFDRYGVPLGEGQLLGTTLKPVRHDGETVGWDAVFRVKQPGRHYYLQTAAEWKRVPYSRISYGEATFNFHVRTR